MSHKIVVSIFLVLLVQIAAGQGKYSFVWSVRFIK